MWVGRGPILTFFIFPHWRESQWGKIKNRLFLRWPNHQAKSSTKEMRQRTRLSQTRGEDAGGRGVVVRVRARVHLQNQHQSKETTRALFSDQGRRRQRVRRRCAFVGMVVRVRARMHLQARHRSKGTTRALFSDEGATPEGTPTLRVCWHGCARARTRARPRERRRCACAHALACLCACAHACAYESNTKGEKQRACPRMAKASWARTAIQVAIH